MKRSLLSFFVMAVGCNAPAAAEPVGPVLPKWEPVVETSVCFVNRVVDPTGQTIYFSNCSLALGARAVGGH